MDEVFSKTFTKCPVCELKAWLMEMLEVGGEKPSGTNFFFDQLSQEAVKRGLAKEGWKLVMELKEGAAIDPNRAVILPIGAKVPAYGVMTDVCMDCGTVFALKLQKGQSLVQMGKTPKIPPFQNNPNTS